MDDLHLCLPQLFYAFLGVVELKLAETGLDAHLKPGMGRLLLRLYEQDGCIIKDLSQNERIACGTLTGLLKRMEAAGLVKCRRCSQDGRAVRVSLTRLGWSLKPRLQQFHQAIKEIAEQGLTEGEVATCRAMMERILESLCKAEGTLRANAKKSKPKGLRKGNRGQAAVAL